MRPPSPSIPEKDFFFAALDQNLRLDGREFLEARPHSLSFGAELGHVECSLGKTRYARPDDWRATAPLLITITQRISYIFFYIYVACWRK